jgi:hypothetical protein
MTRCDQSLRDDLKAYCDHELPLLRRIAVRRHLAGCESCRKEVSEMEGISNDLRTNEAGTGTATLDPGLREKLLAGVPEDGPHKEPVTVERPRMPVKHKLAWGATAGVIGAFFIFAQVKQFSPSYMANKTTMNGSSHDLMAKVAAQAGPDGDLSKVNPQDRDRFEKMTASAPMPPQTILKHYMRTHPQEVAAAAPASPPSGLQASAGNRDVALDWNASSGATRNDEKRSTESDSGYATVNSPTSALSDTGDDPLRRVHKEGALTVEVENPETAGEEVEKRVKSAGGFVATNSLTTSDDGLRSAQMVMKVPVLQFEGIVQQITKLGEVKAKNITGEDITEKVSDENQRERVLEDETHTAEAILKQKGKKSTWQEQETVRDVRIQLAQARARLQMLKKMAELSTITLTLTQKSKPVPPAATGFVPDMKATTAEALGSSLGAAATVLSFVIWFLAYAPIWLPAIFVGRYLAREYRKRNANARA